jgi:Zn-dependent peptidase ImmA (M78 family)/DNA-binding XRE family transcriptional regulator
MEDARNLAALDPQALGKRLQEARNSRGLTQQEAADRLGVARTTLTAIEKGERRVQPRELAQLAAIFNRSLGELLRPGEPAAPFSSQLRASLPEGPADEILNERIDQFQALCEDYVELERICGAPLSRRYPPPYEIGEVSPEMAAEDVATAERNRLGLGDGPAPELRDFFETDVGLRIFFLDLPPDVGGMFAFSDGLGGCVAVNRNLPEERRRHALAHQYGHFLTARYRPEISRLETSRRAARPERFAGAFARAFLMPAGGLRRRFNEVRRSRGGVMTPADLFRLAHFYFVAVEAMARRLEELELLPAGTWDRLPQERFRVREAQQLLGLRLPETPGGLLPTRYLYLAAEALERGDLSEGQLARLLRTDRLEARRWLAEVSRSPRDQDADGADGLPSFSLGQSLRLLGKAS